MAIQENCPVVSNDSDFFIFNVDFILLSSIELSDFSTDRNYIECEIFMRKKMLEHYNISSVELLQLAAALIGNDYLAPEIFDKVFMNIKLVSKRRDMTERHRKIRSLLACLSKESCPKNAINRLLGFLPEKERQTIKEKISLSMETYNGKVNQTIVSDEFSTFNGEKFPDWFEEEYHRCSLPNWFLSVAASRKYFLPTMVETKEKPSAHLCCMELHKLLSQILNGSCKDSHSVKVYARIKSSFTILDSVEVTDSDSSCNLHQLRDHSESERALMLNRILSPGLEPALLAELPQHLQLLTMVFNFWSRASVVSQAEIKAILLCHLILTEVDPKVNNLRNCKKIRTLAQNNVDDEYLKVASNLYHLFHMEESMKTNTKKYDPDIVYKLSQFQAILWVSSAVNQLLGTVYKSPRISQMINCTFIFNCILQQTKVFRKEFLPVSLEEKFENICSKILSCLKYLDSQTTTVKSGKKKMTKKKSQPKAKIGDALSSDNSSDEVDKFFDQENIFSLLKIE